MRYRKKPRQLYWPSARPAGAL